MLSPNQSLDILTSAWWTTALRAQGQIELFFEFFGDPTCLACIANDVRANDDQQFCTID